MLVSVTNKGICNLQRTLQTGYAIVQPIGATHAELIGVHHIHALPKAPFNGIRGLREEVIAYV